MAKVKAENPDLSDADLMVQVSNRVKQAELARRGQAVERQNAFPYHMVGDRIAPRPGIPGAAPPPLVRPPPRYVFPIPDVEEHNDPYPFAYGDREEDEEAEAMYDLGAGFAEPEFEVPQPRPYRPIHYPFRAPLPPDLILDRLRRLPFYDPLMPPFFAPVAGRFHHFDNHIDHDHQMRRYFIRAPPRHNFFHRHHQNPNPYR